MNENRHSKIRIHDISQIKLNLGSITQEFGNYLNLITNLDQIRYIFECKFSYLHLLHLKNDAFPDFVLFDIYKCVLMWMFFLFVFI